MCITTDYSTTTVKRKTTLEDHSGFKAEDGTIRPFTRSAQDYLSQKTEHTFHWLYNHKKYTVDIDGLKMTEVNTGKVVELYIT